MSQIGAQEFVSRVDGDEKFAGELEALKDDPQAVLARVRAEGFDADPAEIRAAFLDRYGDQLSPEQLKVVTAGMDPNLGAGLMLGGLFGGMAIGGAAVAAVV
jgi:predicted ribosomally synthesized peptide with nif11-like leader